MDEVGNHCKKNRTTNNDRIGWKDQEMMDESKTIWVSEIVNENDLDQHFASSIYCHFSATSLHITACLVDYLWIWFGAPCFPT